MVATAVKKSTKLPLKNGRFRTRCSRPIFPKADANHVTWRAHTTRRGPRTTQTFGYWITSTSSTRTRSDCGLVRQNALGGVEVDHRLEFSRLLNRNISALGTLEDLIDALGQYIDEI
jgi:hypothetical protein